VIDDRMKTHLVSLIARYVLVFAVRHPFQISIARSGRSTAPLLFMPLFGGSRSRDLRYRTSTSPTVEMQNFVGLGALEVIDRCIEIFVGVEQCLGAVLFFRAGGNSARSTALSLAAGPGSKARRLYAAAGCADRRARLVPPSALSPYDVSLPLVFSCWDGDGNSLRHLFPTKTFQRFFERDISHAVLFV